MWTKGPNQDNAKNHVASCGGTASGQGGAQSDRESTNGINDVIRRRRHGRTEVERTGEKGAQGGANKGTKWVREGVHGKETRDRSEAEAGRQGITGGGDRDAGRGGKRETDSRRQGARDTGGEDGTIGRGDRGRKGVEGAERRRDIVGKNRVPGAAEREVEGGRMDVDVRRKCLSVTRRKEDRGGSVGRRNGERSKSTVRDGTPQGRRLGYKSLEELSGKDPSVVAITLSCHPALKDLLNETKMRQDLVHLILLVLSKAFSSRMGRGTLQHLARIIKDSGFFRTTLPHYLACMESESNPAHRARYPQDLEYILVIVSEMLNILPASAVQAVGLLVTLLHSSTSSLTTSGVDIQNEMVQKVEQLRDRTKRLQENRREGALRSDTYALLHTGDNDPGGMEFRDFRTMPIYPLPEEFHEDHRPFLRPNLTSQKYASTHLYLDTHFRLLREDFVQPLREGIQRVRQKQTESSEEPLKTRRFDDVLIYFDTKLLVPTCTLNGLAYIVQFDIKPLKFVRWENSKRLLYGSLVCLSCDNFESFLFATVSNRNTKDVVKGKIEIIFTEESKFKLAGIQKNQLFLMVETPAYFEAYRYVLEGLQEQEEDNLPFQRYIVQCSTDLQPPAYLRRGDIYDLSCIADPHHKKRLKPFHSLNENAWPGMKDLGLEESQMKAFQLALTKELAIIQGPPGTGKTFLGLKIAQALMTNRSLWSNGHGVSQMLVVCFTNHALDQFLEGIHKFLPMGIVRIGGRSDSEILKPFNLRELIQSPAFRQRQPSHLRVGFKEVYKDLHEAEREIMSQSRSLECSSKGVLREKVLEKFISRQHRIHLHQSAVEITSKSCREPSWMIEWLDLSSIIVQQRETENTTRNEGTAQEEAVELETEDLIEIAEQADVIQAERFIEDDVGPRGSRDGKREKNMEEALTIMVDSMMALNLDKDAEKAEETEGEWTIQRHQRMKMMNSVRKELQETSAMSEEEEKNIVDIWTLSLPDRWRLYRLWVARYRLEINNSVLESEKLYQTAVDRLAELKHHEKLLILKNAKVIGMTTTGAAKYRKVLQDIRPCLVVVEEAAEVLEAHIITSLSQACQHLILIGDHQQLRPSATVYELEKDFHLDMSMFERLVEMGHPYATLNSQHRMRPEISRLLTPHIYSDLRNHPSVLKYDNVKGIQTNVFFVEHNHLEKEHKDGKSHQNLHEAMFIVALCHYLLLQDYDPEKITILTTYSAQLLCLRNLMPASKFAGVKVHVVDKYQGEENDIVLLSLVRSNTQGKVGFLSIPNRVCVALSRAKKGLYCIGNSEMLGRVKLWRNIFQTLRENNQVGKALTLYCQNHPDLQIAASCAEDFSQAPEGGCTLPCQFRLDCGHVCTKACHPYDPEHKKYKCVKKCQKTLCDLGHMCPLLCFKECPPCPVRIEKLIPRCQHKQMVPCHQDPDTFICQEPCQKTLECGHLCGSHCGEECTSMCKVNVTMQLKCGHSQQDACFYRTHPNEPPCRTPCGQQLKCGHTCGGNCATCYQGRFHLPCSHVRRHLLVCSHMCVEPCGAAGSPCQRPCENSCVHSKCTKPCGQPCVPCIEPCAWQCPHQRCSKLCHEPCDRQPCTLPCAKTLYCGHPCIGLCGDKCPNKCRICDKAITEIISGGENDPTASFIQLEDCRHIFECTVMDSYMGMYDNQQENDKEQVAGKLKECPMCQTPIRTNMRYGSVIKTQLAEIEKLKKTINGNRADIEKRKHALLNRYKENLYTNNNEYMQIRIGLMQRHLTANDLRVMEIQMDFQIRVTKLLEINKNTPVTRDSVFQEKVEEFLGWVNNNYVKFTDQQVFDLEQELQRLSLLKERTCSNSN